MRFRLPLTAFQAALNHHQRQPEKQKSFGVLPNEFFTEQIGFSFATSLRSAGCLTLHNCLMLLPTPLRPAERSILFSGKSVRLFDDAHSAASSHAPKKGCGVREVWRSQTCTSGSPFFCFLFFGEAKKSKCPVGTRRMVKAASQFNYKAQTIFRLPHPVNKKQPENQ